MRNCFALAYGSKPMGVQLTRDNREWTTTIMDLFEPARQAHHWASKRAERYYLGEAAIWAIFEFYNHVCGSRISSCRAVASQLAGEPS